MRVWHTCKLSRRCRFADYVFTSQREASSAQPGVVTSWVVFEVVYASSAFAAFILLYSLGVSTIKSYHISVVARFVDQEPNLIIVMPPRSAATTHSEVNPTRGRRTRATGAYSLRSQAHLATPVTAKDLATTRRATLRPRPGMRRCPEIPIVQGYRAMQTYRTV